MPVPGFGVDISATWQAALSSDHRIPSSCNLNTELPVTESLTGLSGLAFIIRIFTLGVDDPPEFSGTQPQTISASWDRVALKWSMRCSTELNTLHLCIPAGQLRDVVEQ